MSDLDVERQRLVALYGEAIVADIEADAAAAVPWPCRDSMDGRRWCRVHDAPWPSNIDRVVRGLKQQGCEAWVALSEDPE